MFCPRFLQHARELETRRREAEEREKRKQREVQMELERQLKEAEAVRERFINNDHMQVKMHPIDFHVEKEHKIIGIIKLQRPFPAHKQ